MKKVLLFLFLFLCFSNIITAQNTVFWRSTASNGDWENGSNNWFRTCDSYNEPKPDGINCNQYNGPLGRNWVNFDNNAQTTMNVNGRYFDIKSITFKTGASYARIFNNSSGGINVDNGMLMEDNSYTYTNTFNVPIALGASCTFNSNNATFSFTSNFFLNNRTATFQGNNNISGVISESGGTGALTKSGTGTLTLTAQNTYTGLTTVSAGILRLNRTGGTTIPSTNNITVSGGTLRVSTNQTIANLDLSGGGNLTIDNGATLTVTGTYTPGSGAIDNQGTIILQGTAAYSFPTSGSITNMNNLTIDKSGGSVTLSKDLTITGTLSLTAGTLVVGSNTLGLNGGAIAGSATLSTTSSSSISFGGANAGPLTIPTSVLNLNNLTINNINGTPARVDLNSNLSISGALALTSGTLAIGSNTLTLSGTVTVTAGGGFLRGGTSSNLTCSFSNSGTRSIPFDRSNDGVTNVLQDLTLNGTNGTMQLNSVNASGIAQLYVTRAISISTGNTLDLNNSVDDNHLVLVSDGTNLARIADLGTTGSRLTQGANTKIVVERSTLNKRAWRLISAPLTGNGLGYSTSQQSVQYQWQNHQTSPLNTLGGTGFGTNIYGPSGTGMDAVRPGYSMLRWNYAGQNWSNVINTTTEPQFGSAVSGSTTDWSSSSNYTAVPFFLFARGDKTITTTTGSNAGRLRAVGKLLTGQQVFNYPGVGTGTKYVAIANPYAAPVDFESLMAGLSSNLKNPSGNTIYYYWDPSLNNFGGAFGGWVTVTRDNAGGYSQISGTNGRYIQSGTAILIQPSDQLASSATFQESYKATTVVAGTHGAGNSTIDKLVVQLRNADNAIGILDGSIAMFGSGYRREFDKTEDGIKLEQNNETISFINGSLKTGVESRGYIQQADTLYMNLERTTTGTNYAFEFDPSNFDATVTSAKLVDKFLNSETPISLSAKTTVPFSVTATAGSNAADRFMVVFNGTGALPNRGFSVTGEKLGTNKVKINWEAVNEFGVKQYELEHSTDGRTFSKINTQVGKNGNATNSYTYTDNNPANGVNYYRIKTTQHNDIERYSSIITINFKTSSSNNVSVYPNPVKGNVIGLQLQDLEKGMYNVRILSIEGKEVYKQQLQVTGSSLSITINPSTRLAQGTYTLQLVGKNGSYTQKVVVE